MGIEARVATRYHAAMRSLAVVSLAFLSCAACGGEPAPAPAPAPSAPPAEAAVRWEVSQGLWGVELFVVEAGGQARYSFVPAASPAKAVRAESTLSAADLDALARTLTANDLCGLRPKRTTAAPDEATPTLEVNLTGLRCKVALFDGEWAQEPRALACRKAVAALMARVKGAGR